MTPNDIHNAVDTARREGWEEGMEEGRAEGRAEGEAKGRAEGEAKGRAEGRTEEKLALAQKMKSKGFSIADIADMTGLTIAEVEQF